MKKFLILCAVFVIATLGGKGLAQSSSPAPHSPTSSSEVIYTTLDNLKEAAWAVDINGTKNYKEESVSYTINPKDDSKYSEAQQTNGIRIQKTSKDRSIVFYITGISEFKAYAGNAMSGKQLIIEYNDINAAGATPTTKTQDYDESLGESIVATISGLDASKTYKFWVYGNEQETRLYAIKLTKGTVAPPTPTTPALTSFTPADGTTDVAKGSDITLTYNVEVKAPTVTVTPEGGTAVTATVTPTDKGTSFTVSGAVSAYNTTYNISVAETKTADAAATTVTGKEWSFTTAAYPAPTATLDPVNGATNVSVGQYIKITYSAALKETPVIKINGTPVMVDSSYSMKVFGVNRDDPEKKFELASGTTYTVTVDATPSKEDPSVMTDAITDWTFTTEAQSSSPAPLSPTSSPEIIYTTVDSLKEAAWAVDINDGKAYEGTGTKNVTTNPETDQPYDQSTQKAGINIKNTAVNRSIVFYITGISEFKAYAGNANSDDPTKTKALNIEYNEINATSTSIVTEEWKSGYSIVATVSGLEPSKTYKFWVYGNSYDLTLYAIKLTGTVTPPTPALTSFTPANGTTDVAKGSDITLTYNVEVNTPTVTVNGTAVAAEDVTTTDNKTFTVSGVVTAYNTTYTVDVKAAASKEDPSVMTEPKTWSFTTEEETTEATLKITDKTTQWELPYGRDEEHFSVVVDSPESGQLSLVKVHNTDATKRHITLKKVNTKEGDGDYGHEGHMVFKIPAGTTGNLVISADAKDRDIRVLTSTTALTLADLQNSNSAINLGVASGEGKVDIVSTAITADEAKDTYVYIYNVGGLVNYHSVMWTLESCFITAVSPTESLTEVAVGGDLTVTYNAAVEKPAISINGTDVAADKVTSADNMTFTVAEAAAAGNTTYSVVVGATTLKDNASTPVMGKSWIFTTAAPTVKKHLNVCGVEVEVPADASTPILVALPYYSTYNYQDSVQVMANTVGVDCKVTDVTAPQDTHLEYDYTLKIDGESYTMHTARQAFRTSGTLGLSTTYDSQTLDATSVGALYLMPTQAVEIGKEPTAITIIADRTDDSDVAGPNNTGAVKAKEDAYLSGTPTLKGNFVWYDGEKETVITPEITWDEASIDVYKQYGYKTSKIYGTFTHDGMNVRVALIRNLVPPTDELRICTFEDIDIEQYLPSGTDADGKPNSITYRGIKIFASTDDPKTPVRVTYFDVQDPTRSLTVGSYGPYYKSLKIGGKADLGKNDPVIDRETAEPVARYVSIETEKDQVVMALALNGSTTHESKFRIKGPSAVSRDRLLPRGGTGWWGHRAVGGGTAKMYGFDSGTNDDTKGGNVAYCFISAGPGKQYQSEDELKVTFNPSMATVKVGTDVRALTTSNEQVKLVVEIPKVNLQGEVSTGSITSFRTSHLSFRKICSINDLNATDYPNIKNASMEENGTNSNPTITFDNSYGSEDKLTYENMFAANLISQTTETETVDGTEMWVVTLVVEPQKKLEPNAYYELWGNHGMFLVADEDTAPKGTPGDRLLSFAMPLYRIFTADEQAFDYRNFEYKSETGTDKPDRVAPSNVHLDSPTASAAVVRLTVVDDVTATDKGEYVLGAGDAEKTEFGVIFDTPKTDVYGYPQDFPGTQNMLNGGYKYITFNVFIPNTETVTKADATVSIVADNDAETPIKLVDPNVNYVWDSSRGALAPVHPMESQAVATGVWTEVKAASYVASNEFPEFPAAERIKIKVSGAKKAYMDNLVFHTENQLPTSVTAQSNENEAYFDGRYVVAPAECNVEVYGTTGILVLTGKGSTDLSCLNSGIYIVRCGNKVLKIAK